MDKLLSYLAARIELKVCDERRACEKHICNFKQQKKAPEKTCIAMRSNGPQKQVDPMGEARKHISDSSNISTL